MAIQTRTYVIRGPGNNVLAKFVDPSAQAIDRYKTAVCLIQYDDTVPGIVQNLDDYMDANGYDPLSSDLQYEIFARAGGNPAAVAGRSRLYGVTALGVTRSYVRDSDGLVTQLTPAIRDTISGCVATWASVSTVTIGTGVCRDKTDTYSILVNAPITVNIAVNGVNGLDTGAEAANTFYSIFVIADSTGVNPVAGLLSTGGNNPTVLPAGYDIYRKVGDVRNNSTSDFREFVTTGNGSARSIQYRDAISSRQQLTGGAATAVTAINCGSLIPNGALYGRFQFAQRGTVGASFYDDPTQLLANAQRTLLASNTMGDVVMRVTSTQRIAYANSASGGLVDVWITGYEVQL